MSVEQMVRDLLEKAIEDGLVAKSWRKWTDPDPQCRTSGELTGTANLLAQFLQVEAAAAEQRRQRSIETKIRPT